MREFLDVFIKLVELLHVQELSPRLSSTGSTTVNKNGRGNVVIALSECFIHWNIIRISCNELLQKLIMSTFNPHSLARFFQIVCLQELYYQTFSFPQLNPPHFEHFCCSDCLTGSLWIIVCHFLMWSLLPFNQVCISSSFPCFEHNHIAQTFMP